MGQPFTSVLVKGCFFSIALLKCCAILRRRAVAYALYASLRLLVLLAFEQRDEQTGIEVSPCSRVPIMRSFAIQRIVVLVKSSVSVGETVTADTYCVKFQTCSHLNSATSKRASRCRRAVAYALYVPLRYNGFFSWLSFRFRSERR